MNITPATPKEPEPRIRAFYADALAVLERAEIPCLVGGGYAMAHYTGIVRHTKDLDLFLREMDAEPALRALEDAGYRTERTWPPFLVKALHDDAFVDLLHNSGNGLCVVDDEWFRHARTAQMLGKIVQLCPPEEILWSKAFVMDRDRFDGADVAHLILSCGQQFDWQRLLGRFRGHERVLFAQLVLFTYIYPSERSRVPVWVLEELLDSLKNEMPEMDRVCKGTFLAGKQYHPDVHEWGFADARLQPIGPLTPEQLSQLPAA